MENAKSREPDWAEVAQRLCMVTQELAHVVQEFATCKRIAAGEQFIPTEFQRSILQALDGKSLRTDALAAKVGARRKLFCDPGGLPELQERGLVAHDARVGYYRPDAPPPSRD